MSELTTYGRKALATTDNEISRGLGKGLATAGGGGLAIWAVAGFIPFINTPVLLLVALIAGIYFLARK